MKKDYFFGCLFFLFGFVQFNDPDPILWIFLYWYSSFIVILKYFKKLHKSFLYFGLFIYGLYALVLIPKIYDWFGLGMPSLVGEMHASTPYIEFAREFFGLCICLLFVLWNLKNHPINRSKINDL